MIDLRIGDSRQLIKELDDKSIDCVVTSPPYWGLRDYKTEPIIFDGMPDCEHDWINHHQPPRFGKNLPDNMPSIGSNKSLQETCLVNGGYDSDICSLCGAWRGQLGLEPTPELFIKHLLDFFDDVKLKLKDTGNCFVNLGDSYAGSGVNDGTKNAGMSNAAKRNDVKGTSRPNTKVPGLKPKCLCMIPQRFAWGMIEHNWILRNEIIWSKPNHMPESVTDRLTKAHEVIYHFVQQGKYYYDLDAIREPIKDTTHKRYERGWNGNGERDFPKGVQNHFKSFYNKDTKPTFKNPGDVWTITTQPYSEAHFATFPLELVRRPILAGCPVNGTVFDPFAGSGTVGEFCRHNNRNAILFELNLDYKKLIKDRAMINVPELSTF